MWKLIVEVSAWVSRKKKRERRKKGNSPRQERTGQGFENSFFSCHCPDRRGSSADYFADKTSHPIEESSFRTQLIFFPLAVTFGPIYLTWEIALSPQFWSARNTVTPTRSIHVCTFSDDILTLTLTSCTPKMESMVRAPGLPFPITA